MSLYLLTNVQVFPEPTYDPDNLFARSEVGRLERFFERLQREQYCCSQQTKDCLHYIHSRRSTSEQLVSASLVQLKADIDGPFGAVTKADADRQALFGMREQTNELAVKDEVQIEVCKVKATRCTCIPIQYTT